MCVNYNDTDINLWIIMIKITDINIETRIEIIKQYLDEKPSNEIAKNLGIGYGTVWKTLNYHKIPKRGPNDLSKEPMKEDFFENINTEEKAYFLGFLYADGNVAKNLKSASLILRTKDKEIITKLNNLIYFSNFFYEYKQNTVLPINRKKVINDLIKSGCIPNKTLILKFPDENILPKNLYNHFIRGYFDGDGSIGKMKNNNIFYANFVGTIEFCEVVCSILKSYNNKISYKIDKINNKGTVVIRFCGINPIRLGAFLYQNATIYLQRKFNNFKTLTKIQLQKKYENNNGDHIRNKALDVIEISKYYQGIDDSILCQ